MGKFLLSILTPEKEFFREEVESVSLNVKSGRIQLLSEHIPFAAVVPPTLVKIKTEGGEKSAVVMEGFIEFFNNEANIFTDTAEWPQDIDMDRARKAYDRARARLEKKDEKVDEKRALEALGRAKVRMQAGEINGSTPI